MPIPRPHPSISEHTLEEELAAATVQRAWRSASILSEELARRAARRWDWDGAIERVIDARNHAQRAGIDAATGHLMLTHARLLWFAGYSAQSLDMTRSAVAFADANLRETFRVIAQRALADRLEAVGDVAGEFRARLVVADLDEFLERHSEAITARVRAARLSAELGDDTGAAAQLARASEIADVAYRRKPSHRLADAAARIDTYRTDPAALAHADEVRIEVEAAVRAVDRGRFRPAEQLLPYRYLGAADSGRWEAAARAVDAYDRIPKHQRAEWPRDGFLREDPGNLAPWFAIRAGAAGLVVELTLRRQERIVATADPRAAKAFGLQVVANMPAVLINGVAPSALAAMTIAPEPRDRDDRPLR